MSELLDELNTLSSKAVDLDISLLDKKVDQMMPELGFSPDDNDRLVASYRYVLGCHSQCFKAVLEVPVLCASELMTASRPGIRLMLVELTLFPRWGT